MVAAAFANARNAKLDVGKPGRVQASQGVRLMNVPANVTRAAGDVHALGNPHFGVDPIIAKAIAQHIAQPFSAIDAANAATYDANYKKFEASINAKLQGWGATMLPFKGQHVAAYHDSGRTLVTVSVWRSTSFWNRNREFRRRHHTWQK